MTIETGTIERREMGRRYTDPETLNPRRRFRRKLFRVSLGLVLVMGLWKWRYVAYGPVWFVRAHYADRSDLYLGTRNNISNLQLVQQARSYLSDMIRIDGSGNLTYPEALRTQGVRISVQWFEKHHPDAVDFNPFVPAGQGSYAVTWRYFPGCQQTLHSSAKTETDWFDRKGQPCSPVCSITVLMDPNLKLSTIKLTPILS